MKYHQRIMLIGIVLSLLCSVYIIKLAIFQWFPNMHTRTVQGQLSHNRNWRYDAVKQRQHSLILNDGRALYRAEHGEIINKLQVYKLLITPFVNENINIESITQQLSSILNVSSKLIEKQLIGIGSPILLEDEQGQPVQLSQAQKELIEAKSWFGLIVLQMFEETEQSAHIHAIGFTAENPEILSSKYKDKLNELNNWTISSKVGVMGLERSLDPWLHGVDTERVVWYEDVYGRMIKGLGVNYSGKHDYYPLTVQTTINLTQQHAIEQLVEQHAASHIAVVLVDIKTNDIKAMVSKPFLFPRKLEVESMKNLALTSHRPGSIYKLITLAAAIEFGVVDEDEMFFCNGEYGRFGLSCWKHGGHGKQTLMQAFSNSCNVAFAQISERLTAKQIHQTALALGGIEAVSWKNQNAKQSFSMFIEEEKGRAFIDPSTVDRGVIAQASIGQRDALINPLQAATMVASIAREGMVLEARVATQIEFADGKPFKQFALQRSTASPYKLKARTYTILQRYMEEVVQSGTGQLLKQAKVQVAGKSGTAQLDSNQHAANHYWFVGYFPASKPQYALAVTILNEKQATNPATALFKDIVNVIYE